MWHLYVLIASWAAVFTVIQISVVVFLEHYLKSLFLAGLALAIWNIVSLSLDGLINALQKRYASRTLFIVSIIGLTIAILIFLSVAISKLILVVYIAAIFFSVSFDTMEITVVSYILAQSLPAQYWQNLSYKGVAHGIWLLIGFLISAIVIFSSYMIGSLSDATIRGTVRLLEIETSGDMDSSIIVCQFIILFILLALLFFAYIFFDREVRVLSSDYVKTSFQMLKSDTIEGLRASAINIVENTLIKLKREPNQIALKSTDEKQKMNWNEIFWEVSSSIMLLFRVFRANPPNTTLVWSISTVTIFSYWDTFLGTFLPLFFTELLENQTWFLTKVPGSILMLIFVLPALILFPVFAWFGDKFWRHYFMIGGLAITCISVFFIWVTPYSMFMMFILAWFWITIGYAMWMSWSAADCANKINEFVAVTEGKWEIDTNVSAGPLMIINNFGNIIGPLIGGYFIENMWFQPFFIFFSFLLLLYVIYSLYRYREITTPAYVFETKEEAENKNNPFI